MSMVASVETVATNRKIELLGKLIWEDMNPSYPFLSTTVLSPLAQSIGSFSLVAQSESPRFMPMDDTCL